MNDKVVPLPLCELPENLLQCEDRDPYGYCAHARITLDEHQRTVTCRDCGRVLDPFGFLQHNAHALQLAWRNHDAAKHKVAELTERIAVLAKEYKRLQAQVARLRDKVPAVNVRQGGA